MTTPSVSELASAIGENVLLNRELNEVRERMNALAVSNDKLTKENESLRANQLPTGAVCFVPTGEKRPPKMGEGFITMEGAYTVACSDWTEGYDRQICRRVEAQGAEPVRCANESGQGLVDALRQEVERLKGESKANQEAADVLRLWDIYLREHYLGVMFSAFGKSQDARDVVAGGLVPWLLEAAKEHGITLPAKDEQPEPVPEPNVVAGTLRDYVDFLNGTSPVHQQLAEAKAEIENLVIALNESNDTIERYTKRLVECDRDREAWDAVDRHAINVECWGMFKYRAIRYSGPSKDVIGKVESADPREAVLELAKSLEGGK